MGGAAIADLIVEDCGDVVDGGEVGHAESAVVGHAGAAVNDDERAYRRLNIAERFVPGFARLGSCGEVEVDFSFGDSGC